MVKVIGIIKNDSITGVEYGLTEANESVTEIQHAHNTYKKTKQKVHAHKMRTKQKTK